MLEGTSKLYSAKGRKSSTDRNLSIPRNEIAKDHRRQLFESRGNPFLNASSQPVQLASVLKNGLHTTLL
jgi:hypothetical protein